MQKQLSVNMKTLKEYLNEDFFGNLGIGHAGKRQLIEEWLKKYSITKYTINKDLTIDVNGDVYIDKYKEDTLPDYIQFYNVKGKFVIVGANNLKSLRGCPNKCLRFVCNRCYNLTSLEGAPKECEYFNCEGCKSLQSLEGAPKECKRFICTDCYGLTSLEGAPEIIHETLDVSSCINLKSLKGGPKIVNNFILIFCLSLESLEGAPKECDGFNCSGCDVLKTLDNCPKVNSTFIYPKSSYISKKYDKEEIKNITGAKNIHMK